MLLLTFIEDRKEQRNRIICGEKWLVNENGCVNQFKQTTTVIVYLIILSWTGRGWTQKLSEHGLEYDKKSSRIDDEWSNLYVLDDDKSHVQHFINVGNHLLT